jgi:acetyl esterase/lipase
MNALTWASLPLAAVLLLTQACAQSSSYVAGPPGVPSDRVADAAEQRLYYGSGESQFGELRLPTGSGPHPVALLIHGGCWSAAYGLDQLDAAAERLREVGVASWTIEYRRLGEEGGGWPGTFHDVPAGADYLLTAADTFALDLSRVVAVGHSAGGHLALWLAARDNLSETSELWHPTPLPLAGVVALAAITDLEEYAAQPGRCNAGARQLLNPPGGRTAPREAEVNPRRLLPLWIPLRLLHGSGDAIVPPDQSRSFATAATDAGDDVELQLIPDADHFDLVTPSTPGWQAVEEAILELLGRP